MLLFCSEFLKIYEIELHGIFYVVCLPQVDSFLDVYMKHIYFMQINIFSRSNISSVKLYIEL